MFPDMTETKIHSTAIVDSKASLGPGVEVGPYAIVNAGVTLGDGCRVGHHATIDGPSQIGPRNEFFPYAVIGFKTQDLKYKGEPTYLEIGADNTFREFCTVHRATGPGVTVGPYAVIGAGVELGEGSSVGHHATLEGPSKIGPRNIFFPYAAIGFVTQDLKYQGEPTYLEIGGGNTFREFCTIHRGTGVGEKTVIGDGNLFLAYSHVAHDCVVGNHTIFSNNATLAGHVVVGDHAVISGLSAVHQFCRIGAHSIIGGCAKIVQDVPPYLIADGNPANLRGVNHVGLERRGFVEADIKALRRAYRLLADRTLNFSQAVEKIEGSEDAANPHVKILIDFLRSTQRGVIRPEPLAGG